MWHTNTRVDGNEMITPNNLCHSDTICRHSGSRKKTDSSIRVVPPSLQQTTGQEIKGTETVVKQ